MAASASIRFFVALYGLLFHSKQLSEALASHSRFASNFVANGFSALSLFFLLSGFILSYTYSGRVSEAGQKRRFWEARFARLYPAYWLSLIVTMAVHRAMPKLGSVVAAMLMVQAWNPLDKQMWGACNFVCWTLSVEALFYLLFPWIQQRAERLGYRALFVATCISLLIALLFTTTRKELGYHGAFDAVPLPLLRLPEFIVGIGMGNLFLHERFRNQLTSFRAYRVNLLPYAALATIAVILSATRGPLMSLALIPFAGLILGLSAAPSRLGRLLSSKILIFGGEISYAFYLLQVATKDFVIREADILHISSAGLRFLGMMAILMLASVFTYKWIEVPARGRIRSWFTKREGGLSTTSNRTEMLPQSPMPVPAVTSQQKEQ